MAALPTEYFARMHGAEQAAAALMAFAEGLAAIAERPGAESLAEAEVHFARGRAIAEALNARPVPAESGRLELVINLNGCCFSRGSAAELGRSLAAAIDRGPPITVARPRA